MCFDTSHADWTAGCTIQTTGTSIKPTRCDECGKRIEMYEWRRHVWMQEHEECQRCEYEELYPDDPPCEEHDYGETCDYDRCETCDKILRAIEQYELRAGCPVQDSQPLLGELKEELWQSDDAGLYASVAIEAFPELGNVPWLTDILIGSK